MKSVYIAGPYTDPRGEWYVQQNIQDAAELAANLWTMGLAPLCPHLNTAHFGGVVSYDTFLKGDFALIRGLDAVVMMPTWKRSNGARQEHEYARGLGKPIFYWPKDADALRQYAARDLLAEVL